MVHKNIENICVEYGKTWGIHGRGLNFDEYLGFVIEYLQSFEVVQQHVWDANEEEGDVGEVVEGAWTKFVMSPTLRDLAHQYVLTNISIMTPWIE